MRINKASAVAEEWNQVTIYTRLHAFFFLSLSLVTYRLKIEYIKYLYFNWLSKDLTVIFFFFVFLFYKSFDTHTRRKLKNMNNKINLWKKKKN